MKKLTRAEALRLSQRILETAERERAQAVAEEAERGLQWPDEPPDMEVARVLQA